MSASGPRRRGPGIPASFGTGPISMRTRFERFPASVKGAFVFRGEDANPHQVALAEATVVRFPPGQAIGQPIPVEPVVLDVAPHRDLFVPFEFPVTELDPGWYELLVRIELDGVAETLTGDRRFAVAWPRGAVHRGRVAVGRSVDVGGASVEVERVDGDGTSTTVHLRVDPPGDVEVEISAPGGDVAVLETTVDPQTGRGKAIAYPVMAGQPSLSIRLRRPGAPGGGGSVEVQLR